MFLAHNDCNLPGPPEEPYVLSTILNSKVLLVLSYNHAIDIYFQTRIGGFLQRVLRLVRHHQPPRVRRRRSHREFVVNLIYHGKNRTDQ